MAILSGVSDVKEQQQQDTQTALLLKGAVQGIWDDHNKTAIVTANGHVAFTAVADPRFGMKFTLEQWSEIVEFVGKQIAPAVESWEPDWDNIPAEYIYAAVDLSGKAFAFRDRPMHDYQEWFGRAGAFDHNYIGRVTLPIDLEWTQTLRRRPGV